MSKSQAEHGQVDLFGNMLPTPAPRPPSAIQKRIINTAVESADESPDRIDFLHTILCQVGMPRQKTEARVFERMNGSASLKLTAGELWDGQKWVEQPLPYGAKPRLIMVHICGEAVRLKSPEVEIGRSIHEFMKRLGFDTNSRAYAMVRKQILALAACDMRLGYQTATGPATLQTHPIEHFQAWVHNEGRQQVLWPGVIRLAQPFFNALDGNVVPLDPRHLAAVSHSALAVDAYTWLAHRLCRVRSLQGQLVRWNKLHEQFGQEYKSIKDFKKAFLIALREATTAYQKARVQVVPGGLLLFNSPPPIEKTQVQVLLPDKKK